MLTTNFMQVYNNKPLPCPRLVKTAHKIPRPASVYYK